MRHARFFLPAQLVLVAAAFGLNGAHAASKKAHQHGVAALGVAVEKARISITLDSPLDNLLGFERAPRNDDEKQRAEALVAKIKAADTLFRIDPAAGCKLASVEIDAPLLGQGSSPAPAAGSTHADLEADFEFTCTDGSKAGFVEATLFEAFSRLQRIEAQIVGPKGQAKAVLKRPAARITLVR
jgi:Protein of unknown function (DUF2796)